MEDNASSYVSEDQDDEDGLLLEPQCILDDADGDEENDREDDDDEEVLLDDEDEDFEGLENVEENCGTCKRNLNLHFATKSCGYFFEVDEDEDSPRCPVCRKREPSPEHIASHFVDELSETIEDTKRRSRSASRTRTFSCKECQDFTASDLDSLAIHMGVAHELLEELLRDPDLVETKRTERDEDRERRLRTCPICETDLKGFESRKWIPFAEGHFVSHFMNELCSFLDSERPERCPECDYVGNTTEHALRHLALHHGKVQEFLDDKDVVERKKRQLSTKSRKDLCPVCEHADPSREHISRHFMKELLALVESFPSRNQCAECSYRADKVQHVARHVALVHSKLDEILTNTALVEERKVEYHTKPHKFAIGSNCPVCDQKLTKQHGRVHVIWHYIDELRAIVQGFADPSTCELCEYTNPIIDKVVKHIALGHSKLDELLEDKSLLATKRIKFRSKPKRESMGNNCVICNVQDPPREHVARHFSEELNQFVSGLNGLTCPDCSYKGEKPKNLGLHIALVHGLLDVYLKNEDLVQNVRTRVLSKPQKLSIGPNCPICDMKFTKSQRDHVSWHFMDELRDIVQQFEYPNQCGYCNYTSEKLDNLVKHVALGHSKLDELLLNAELVAAKRQKAMLKPKKISIGPSCPICDAKDVAREHCARHFSDELLAIVNSYEDPTRCIDCPYRGDGKPKTISIHVGLVHAKLDMFLADKDLVYQKRERFFSQPKKLSIGPQCPVCGIEFTKNQNRDHVAWHFVDELRSIVNQFPDPTRCTQCPYVSDTSEKMVKHVALGHSMLDGFLQNEELLEQKRLKALSKPRKVSYGKNCPICQLKDAQREHVARHFGDELLDIVMTFPDPTQCSECQYRSDKPKNVAIHIGLVHSILDQFLSDEGLVLNKIEKVMNKPQKVSIGTQCPVCGQGFNKNQNGRDHVSWHFMDELREIVMMFPDTTSCVDCHYTTDRVDNLVKHVALGHNKLDELLLNDELVARKREIASTKVKKVAIGKTCPICDIQFVKSQNRDHIAWHFIDQLRDLVYATTDGKSCNQCYYTSEKLDNLVKHVALGHSKLDELLLDEDLVKQKREIVKKKPKRISFTDCPICGQKGKDRDHVARHYMPELLEMVERLPKKKQCNLCEYRNQRKEYLAKHLALFHCKLDELILDADLLEAKKKKASDTPKRMSMGDACVVCGFSNPNREHVARHFLKELISFVTETFDNPKSCNKCEFASERVEYVARHYGLVHFKIDEILQDTELVRRRSEEVRSTMPSYASLPTKELPLRESTRKRRLKENEEEIETKRKKSSSQVKESTCVVSSPQQQKHLVKITRATKAKWQIKSEESSSSSSVSRTKKKRKEESEAIFEPQVILDDD